MTSFLTKFASLGLNLDGMAGVFLWVLQFFQDSCFIDTCIRNIYKKNITKMYIKNVIIYTLHISILYLKQQLSVFWYICMMIML